MRYRYEKTNLHTSTEIIFDFINVIRNSGENLDINNKKKCNI